MEMRFTYRFEAAHRFVGATSPKCMTPHGHTWWIHLLITNETHHLNSNQMMAEFAGLKAPWKAFIDSCLDHSFFHHREDPIAKVCADQIPGFRGLPFPGDPTTEMIAILCLAKARVLIENYNKENDLEFRVQKIEIQETPTNAIILKSNDEIVENTLSTLKDYDEAWWNQAQSDTRVLKSNY